MWYYTLDQKRFGPLTDSELDRLLAEKVITPETLAWKEGQAEWQPLGLVRAASPQAVSALVCEVCGKSTTVSDLIEINGLKVCAVCKPVALQQLLEGAAPQQKASAWREGKKVVTYDGTHLPVRCLKCNGAVTPPPLKRKLFWHTPYLYLLIFVNLLLYALVSLVVRKKAVIHVSLCPTHRRKRKNFIIGSWLGILLSFILIGMGVSWNHTWLVVAGFVIIPVALIAGTMVSRVVVTTRIKNQTVWFKGADPAFLASLPPWEDRFQR
jgi:hypothetical protein